MSDGKESSTKNHRGCALHRIKGVWSCHDVKTLKIATATVAGTVWEQGELIFTISDAALFGAF